MNDNPSRQVLDQRMRNRIIEVLETAASYDEQRQYQEAVPYVHVPTEMICMWGADLVGRDWRSWWLPPVFTADELEAIARFDEVFRSVVDALPKPWPELSELIGSEAWERFRSSAADALAVFQRRGKLSEDAEESL